MAYPQRSLAIVAALLLVGCEEQQQQDSRPTPTVEVMTPQAQAVPNTIELPGRVQAIRIAEVRARVNGIIEERLYEEGTAVEAGDQLFQIDPRESRANLNAAQARLERARATAMNAAQDVERYRGLVEKQAISQQEFDAAQAQLRMARADVKLAEAQVQTAELDLDYTRVEAPIDGIAGRAEVTVGALVRAADGTLLTRVEQLDPVYVNFSQSSSDLLGLRAQIASGEVSVTENEKIAVELVLENGEAYPHSGYVDFRAMSIDRSTGTVQARAQVPNPDHLLLPGMFVEARVTAGQRTDALVIPQRAVIMQDQGPSVMVVGEDGKAASRDIKTGSMREGNWIVLEGLEPGEQVIVSGWQDLRGGTEVETVRADESQEDNGDGDAP
ncbi:efflux RND transporter periplasmic adaptor subunit [Halopseudomonas salina]|uniref:MexE family multidrug efflux RND transporter periplasmic adaptor subunit n=1 Tax=Halopseudomonas salina TaxID=1323744 RepID=A0ABQ1NYM5_9GAMM|nr:efflux RND transporter periplasmic adaptor subunit [Halopseudomonas salina]GGC87662.1 MexE family multidrug efflux RND transporter periplasmic adaptor subunit [Halopseudomonas salina]